MQDVAGGEVLGLWVCRATNLFGGSGEIVAGVPELNIGLKQQPIGAGLSERHADTASVHDASRSDHSIKLHMGMTTNDQGERRVFRI